MENLLKIVVVYYPANTYLQSTGICTKSSMIEFVQLCVASKPPLMNRSQLCTQAALYLHTHTYTALVSPFFAMGLIMVLISTPIGPPKIHVIIQKQCSMQYLHSFSKTQLLHIQIYIIHSPETEKQKIKIQIPQVPAN